MLGRPGTLINCIERYLRIIASGKMKIESVDFFYLSIPEVLDIGDGSQDVTPGPVTSGVPCRLGRVRSGSAGLNRQPGVSDVAQCL